MRKNALWIEFDGQSSQGYDVYQINFENGLMQNEEIITTRTINKVQRQNSSVVDFYSVTNSPLTIRAEFYCSKPITEEKKYSIIQWLKKDTYKTLRFDTMPDTYYYVIATKIDLNHNTMAKGYFSVEFECNAPYGYTQILLSDEYIVNGNNTVNLNSLSVFNTKIIKIITTINGDSNFLIRNLTNNTEINFNSLVSGTKITIDCLNHNIYAVDINGDEILIQDKKQNHSWLEFVPGINNLYFEGNCDLQILWQGIKL